MNPFLKEFLCRGKRQLPCQRGEEQRPATLLFSIIKVKRSAVETAEFSEIG
jgi:hypothetical protein